MVERYPKTTLLLIRHGQALATPGGGADDSTPPLSQLGRRQVAALASELRSGEPIDVLYTSPFTRAAQTAEILADELGLEPQTDPRLAEFRIPGAIAKTVEDRPDLLVWKPEHESSSGETLEQFGGRVASSCADIVGKHAGRRVAIVSHAGTIDAQLRWSVATNPGAPWDHEFVIANAAVSVLEHWPHGRVRGGAPTYTALPRIGDVEHLGEMVTGIV